MLRVSRRGSQGLFRVASTSAWSPFTSPGPDEPQGVHRCDVSIHMRLRDCIQSKISQLGLTYGSYPLSSQVLAR